MTDLPRNLAHERALTTVAAAAAGAHGRTLLAYAHERALPGPVLDALGRDFVQEAREEAADWLNYLCWAIRQLDETRRQSPPARAARAELMNCIGNVCRAYDDLARAQVHLDLLADA